MCMCECVFVILKGIVAMRVVDGLISWLAEFILNYIFYLNSMTLQDSFINALLKLSAHRVRE